MEIPIVVAISAALGFIGFALGRSLGRSAGLSEGNSEAALRIQAIAESVGTGRELEHIAPGSPEAELQSALKRGWPTGESESNTALNEAVERISVFLDAHVRKPLVEVRDGVDANESRERISRILGTLADIDFFLEEPPIEIAGQSLASLVQHVAQEFSGDQDVGLRLQLDSEPVRAVVSGPVVMDVMYLILHNAVQFGGGIPIDISVRVASGRSVVRVRDYGPGFSNDALQRAFDPFYSTSSEGLGLGLGHARLLIEKIGGEIELRNATDDGAEVLISFPSS